MKRAAILLTLTFAAGLPLGCKSETAEAPAPSENAAPAANASTGQPAQQPAAQPPRQAVQVAADANPEHVVTYFLEAIRAGDEATTASLLTTKAREETAKHDMDVAPQSAPGAKYQVTPAQMLADNPDGAHVNSVWTETYPDGTISYEVVWVLRRQQEGWRIAGMAVELIPGQPMEFLNFEDPADMVKKQQAAQEAFVAQQQAEAQQAAAQQAAAQQAPPAQQGLEAPAGNDQFGAPAMEGPALQTAQPPSDAPGNSLRPAIR